MRVKVLEALAAGKALVASPLAVSGLDVVDGEQVILAEGEDEFVEALSRLLGDPARRAALGAQAHAWAEANLGWDRSVACYEHLYRQLVAARQPA
jgi:glycosyltransferase involved in cell wall biosynthesis